MGFKRSFDVVQAHCGEPMHVITGGVPTIPGDTVYEQMKWMPQKIHGRQPDISSWNRMNTVS